MVLLGTKFMAYLQICKSCVLNSGEMNDNLRAELAI